MTQLKNLKNINQWGYVWKQPLLFTLWFNTAKCTKFSVFLSHCNLKEKDQVISIFIMLTCQKLGSVELIQKNLNCLHLNEDVTK